MKGERLIKSDKNIIFFFKYERDVTFPNFFMFSLLSRRKFHINKLLCQVCIIGHNHLQFHWFVEKLRNIQFAIASMIHMMAHQSDGIVLQR